jgi:ribosomal protein L37E
MNWGVGYRDYHGKYAHVPLNDLYLSVARFVRFWQAHSGVSLPYTAAPRWWQYGGFESGSTADVDVECPACGEESFDPAAGLCVTCGYDENEPAVTHRLHGLSEKEWTRIEKQAQESTDVA